MLGDLALKQTWTIVQEKGVQVNLAIGNLINPILLPIILDIDIQKELPLEVRAQNILDQAKYLETFDGGIYFLDQQGKVFITRPERPDLLGQDWSDNPDLRFIKANPGRGAFTDLRFVGPSGQGIICFSQSINGPQGEFLGAGYYCFTIDPTAQTNLFIVLNSLNLGSDVLIMDGNQHVIYSPDLSQLGKDLSGEAYIQNLLQSQNMSIRFPDGTEDRVIIYNPVDVTINDRNRWVITKEQSWAEIMQPTLPYQRLLYGLLALGVLVPVLVTAYGVRHITNPIQKLIKASKQVTAGKFNQRIAVCHEQHPTRLVGAHEHIDQSHRGACLTCPSCHDDQGFALALGKILAYPANGFVLIRTVDDTVVNFNRTERLRILAQIKQIFQIFAREEAEHLAFVRDPHIHKMDLKAIG